VQSSTMEILVQPAKAIKTDDFEERSIEPALGAAPPQVFREVSAADNDRSEEIIIEEQLESERASQDDPIVAHSNENVQINITTMSAVRPDERLSKTQPVEP